MPQGRPSKCALGAAAHVTAPKIEEVLTEAELSAVWAHVCASLEEPAPITARPPTAGLRRAGELVEESGPALQRAGLPVASPYSLESAAISTKTSAKSTVTKNSPWSLGSAAKGDATPVMPFCLALEDAPGNEVALPALENSAACDAIASMVDAAQLRMKLEKLSRRPASSASSRRPGSSRQASKKTSLSRSATPLSVHSVSAPPQPATHLPSPSQLPSPSSLPWLQLSGTQHSLPSARALRACAGAFGEQVCAPGIATPTVGLPPLPGALGDGFRTPQSLPGAVGDSSWADDADDPFRRVARQWAADRPDVEPRHGHPGAPPQDTVANRRHAQKRRDGDMLSHPSSPSRPIKRSRLKRMLSRLWRLGCSRGT